jgi:hypothetical protein
LKERKKDTIWRKKYKKRLKGRKEGERERDEEEERDKGRFFMEKVCFRQLYNNKVCV